MTLGFSFSDKAEAALPQASIQAAQSLGDIEKTVIANEIGEGKVLDDGSIIITFELFRITVKPDGSFHGRRLTSRDRKPLNINGTALT